MRLPRPLALPIVAALLAASIAARAAPPEGAGDKESPATKPGPRAEALAFLKDHVIGKTLHTGLKTGKLEEKLEYEFTRRTTFCNLTETDKGLTFDAISVITQTNFDLDDKGKRVLPGRVQDRVLTSRNELRELESAPLLVGFGRIVSNSIVDPTGSAGLLRGEVKDGKLVFTQSGQLSDYFSEGGRSRLASGDYVEEFSVVGAKLERTLTITTYDVDPATFKRTPHGEPEKLTDKEDEDAKPAKPSDKPDEDAKSDRDKLQGAWAQVSKERNGEKQEVKKTIVVFTGDKFETTTDGKPTEAGTIAFDPTKHPGTYDVTIVGDFKENGNTYHGIYELDGDALRTCVQTDPHKERPTEFASKPGTGLQLIVWKRVKP